MIEDEIQIAPMGHNSGLGPVEIARQLQTEALHDTVRRGGKTFAQRKVEFLTSASRQTVRDRQSAADAADTIKLAGAVLAEIETDRKEMSAPYLEAHRTFIAIAADFWEPVESEMARLEQEIENWNAEEEKRISDQQREQNEQMAAMRAKAVATPTTPRAHIDYTARTAAPAAVAAPLPARRTKIRGDLGGTISKVDERVFEIEDLSKVPDYILSSQTVKDAILAVARRMAKDIPEIPGIRITTRDKLKVGK